MQITIDIDDGGKSRKALPLRAIPYVTYWRESPDSIVRTLAAPKTEKFRNGLTVRLRHNELFAYQMGAQGNFAPVPPSQWENWMVTLDSLTKKSMADERDGAENENHASWRINAVLELPDNGFIWMDEFQHWYSSTRPLIVDAELVDVEHVTPEDMDGEYAGGVGKEEDTLCLMPIFPPEIENKVWRYANNFEAAPAAQVKDGPATTPADDKPDVEKIHRGLDGAPYLMKGRNSRKKVEAWVAWQAKDKVKESDKITDLADRIRLEADKWGYESERKNRDGNFKLTTACIIKMIPAGTTGGRSKNKGKKKK